MILHEPPRDEGPAPASSSHATRTNAWSSVPGAAATALKRAPLCTRQRPADKAGSTTTNGPAMLAQGLYSEGGRPVLVPCTKTTRRSGHPTMTTVFFESPMVART